MELMTVSHEYPAESKARLDSPYSSHYFYRNRRSKATKLSGATEELTSSSSEIRENRKRGLNVDIHVVSPTSRADGEASRFLDDFENDLLQEMDRTLKGLNLSEGAAEDEQLCRNCEEMMENGHVKRIETFMQPASHCDHWDPKARTCWFERNIGDTVTFVLATNVLNTMTPKVTWKKEFYVRHSSNRKEFVIEPVTSMWNIAIGRRDMELRLSPITETDVDFNRFSATVQEEGLPQYSSNKVHFQIKVVPIDMGFVYLGETLELNMARFCGLPYEGIRYQWLLESDKDSSTLPSNMKISPSGSSVTISELRKEQEGVIACAAYTGLGAFVAKRRFLIREISENNDISLAILNLQQHKNFFPAHRHSKSKRGRSRRSSSDIDVEEEYENQFDNVKRAAESLSSQEIGEDKNAESPESRNQQEYSRIQSQLIENPNMANRDFPEKVVEDERRLPLSNMEMSQSRLNSPPRVSDSNQRIPISAADGDSSWQEGAKYQFVRQSDLPLSNVRVSEGNSFPERLANQREESEIENTAQRKQTKNILLEIEGKVSDGTPVVDKMSRFMAPCVKDRQCSGDAVCIREKTEAAGVCRCLPGYRGDGIFCDKEALIRVGQVSRAKKTLLKQPLQPVKNQ